MSIAVSGAKLIEEAELQVNHAEYDGAWSTYREFRESVGEADHDARTLRMLDEAERAAETSFRAGAVGFERPDADAAVRHPAPRQKRRSAAVEPLDCGSQPRVGRSEYATVDRSTTRRSVPQTFGSTSSPISSIDSQARS